MIAERNNGVTVQSNISGQAYAAGIDDENMAHIISLFTDLYSDQKKAVIREYSTNARDAQIEAGYNGPIEVSLPTALAPFFKVKDYGVGLDAEDIRKIYSRYGTSTKRATNDQNGMLGLGCKSALTYTQQFTVESVKGGIRTVCSISREADGVPVFTVVASIPDSGPNGTEVIVPVQRHHHGEFTTKAAEFYSYWPEGTVLLDGEQPKRIEGLQITDDLLLIEQRGAYYDRQPHSIVMGNVAYPVEEDKIGTGLPSTYRLVINVPIGAVSFTPSRESLMFTKQTTETLSKVGPRVAKAVAKAVQAEIDKASTPREAIQAMKKWRSVLGSSAGASAFSFKGSQMPEKIDGDYTLVPFSHYGKKSYHEKARLGMSVDVVSGALFVVGYTLTNFTAQHARKLRQFAADNGLTCDYFALCAETPKSPWIKGCKIVQWTDVNAVKLPKNSPVWRNGRPTGSYDAYIAGNIQHIQADEIDQEEAIYVGRAMNKSELHYIATVIGRHDPAATVVCLPENRYAKFMRNFPAARSHREGIQEAYDAFLASLSPGVRLKLAIEDNGDVSAFEAIDPKRVDDAAVRAACWVVRRVSTQKARNAMHSFSKVRWALGRTEAVGVEWNDPLDAYPLVKHLNARRAAREADFYLYLNAAYAARKEA